MRLGARDLLFVGVVLAGTAALGAGLLVPSAARPAKAKKPAALGADSAGRRRA